jgi:hypothetical protein
VRWWEIVTPFTSVTDVGQLTTGTLAGPTDDGAWLLAVVASRPTRPLDALFAEALGIASVAVMACALLIAVR